MNISNLKKLVGIGIVILFVLSTCTPLTGGTTKNIESEIFVTEPDTNLHDQDAVVSCQILGIPSSNKERSSTFTTDEAEYLLEIIEQLQQEIVKEPGSDTVNILQQEIITFSHEHQLLPEEITLDAIQSPMQKILSRYPINNPLPWPYRGTELFCNYVSTGEGSALPIIVFPRLLPILMTPIPRLFFAWDTYEGITSCGGLLSRTGFIAYGNQRGLTLGFWGIGFSIFLPPIMAYGIIGYAMYCRVDADQLELWPPNYPPEVNSVFPMDEAINLPIETNELQFFISDPNKESMSYSVITEPYVGGGNANNKPDGSYSVPIFGLEGSETYTWTVQVTDGVNTVEETYSFSTEPVAPVISDPSPEDDERYIPINLSELRFHLRDLQGDLMDYTVETSPDIGSGSGIDVVDGYYTVPVSGLDHMTEYTWYVNATDGQHVKHKTFTFQTEPIMVFSPFDEGWQYRKSITIDHTKVAGDLQNFPVLVSITDPDLSNNAQTDGDDLLFMDSVGVAHRLYHEIEEYEDTSGKLITWINITSLDASSDTIFYMYYGNQLASNQQFSEKVWNNHYQAVYHLKEQGTGSRKDSTIHQWHGTPHNYDGDEGTPNGKINGADNFDGNNDHITTGASFDYEHRTVSLWFNTETIPSSDHDHIICQDSNELIYGSFAASIIPDGLVLNAGREQTTFPHYQIPTNTWFAIQLVRNGPTTIYYLDGSQVYTGQSGSGGSSYYANRNTVISTDRSTIRRYFDGTIDEIRILDTVLTSDWILTEFTNQNNPNMFYIVGPEETGP